METLFTSVLHKLQEIEDRFNIVIKLEVFTDYTGTCLYLTDTKEMLWRHGFSFAGPEVLMKELDKFEDYLGS